MDCSGFRFLCIVLAACASSLYAAPNITNRRGVIVRRARPDASCTRRRIGRVVVRCCLVAALVFTGAHLAHAEGFNAGDSCSSAGALHTKNDSSGGYLLVCNGSIWVLSLTYATAATIGIGSTTPVASLDLSQKTDALALPSGTTGQRPGTPANGMLRYNSTVPQIEAYYSSAWNALGSSSIALDNLTDAVTDYTTDHNMRLGSNTAMFSGAQYNLFIGEGSGTAGTSNAAAHNTGAGYHALNAITTGGYNTAFGNYALEAVTTATGNVAVGYGSLANTVNGNGNVALGRLALQSNVSKSLNVALGHYAMRLANDTSSGTSTYNTAIGAYALEGGATASGNTGTRNTAIGAGTLGVTSSGSNNVALGVNALATNTNGAGSVALGDSALAALATGGTQNIGIGYQAGDNITTGDLNIIIGYDIDAPSATGNSQLNIGGTIYGDLSDDRIGIGGVPAAGIELDVTGDINYTGQIADVSDRRLKDNIRPLAQGQLAKILALHGVSFTMKGHEETELGLIAQDVEPVYPDLVRTTSKGNKTLNYIGLIAPLIEALKEQQAEIHDLQATNQQLLLRVEALEQESVAHSAE